MLRLENGESPLKGLSPFSFLRSFLKGLDSAGGSFPAIDWILRRAAVSFTAVFSLREPYDVCRPRLLGL
ncbi:hypothetical protein CLOLEP_03599 [[Clostridium] leptum DSM 753]|uniref:Uncharacterized protein n=1 Tax=[Clostridium] leptum DSM 753 TaxID=428125 RepID=A7VYC1_9FIRM|nr:hypothetical protein CLOLEP_03599 [[Clostridium] leptum DSM 753]